MNFDIRNFSLQKSVEELSDTQKEGLAYFIEKYSTGKQQHKHVIEEIAVVQMVLPYFQFGLNSVQVENLLEQIPLDWNWDHREMYFDFRIKKWIKHIEPPSLEDSMQEYLTHSNSQKEAVDYIQKTLKYLLENS